MVVKIIIEMVRMKLSGNNEGIGTLIRDLKEPADSVELRLNIVTPPRYAKEKGREAVQTLKEYIQVCFNLYLKNFQYSIIFLIMIILLF